MKEDLAVYIHIPFCAKKCDYCDFFSVVTNDDEKEAYVKALVAEIEATEESADYEVVSIFFGGGTPSILAVSQIAEILTAIRAKFDIAEGTMASTTVKARTEATRDVEITIECNPGTVDKEKLKAYKEMGVNRISFGLQSTNNDELLRLGRIHTYDDFLKSYQDAREVGFDNISVDLMSGIPEQTVSSWRKSLEVIALVNPSHISAYSLIIEEDTPFAKRELILPAEIEEREMYEMTNEILGGFGYHQYEISNYAKETSECQHNIGYWKRCDYLGFGVAAASLIKDVRYTNIKDLHTYIEDSCIPKKIRCEVESLSETDKMEEFMFLGLRMMKGVNDTEFREEFGISLCAAYGAEIDKLVEQELLGFDEQSLKLTRKGISVSNYVFAQLLAG